MSAQSTTITFARWQVTPSRIKISVDDPIARFEQVQPNTKVEALVIPNGPPYTAKLLTMIAGDVAPDVMGLPDPFGILPLFGQKGVLVDLGPLIARDAATVQPTDFLPQALKVGQWQGKQYGLLISPLSTAVLLYNADALQNAGVSQTPAEMYDAGKWTWNDFTVVARQGTRRPSSGGAQFGFLVSFAIQQAMSFVWEAGGDLLNAAGTKSVIDNSSSIAGLQFLDDLLHKDAVSPTSTELKALPNGFNSGQICLGWSWAHTVGQNLAGVKFNWDIVPLPVGPAGEVVNGNYNNIGMSKTSKGAATAWQFVQFMTSGAEEINEQHQALPARRSVYQQWLQWMEQSPRRKNLKYLQPLVAKSRDLPYSPTWPQIGDAWTKETAFLQQGTQSPSDVARALAAAINAVLQ